MNIREVGLLIMCLVILQGCSSTQPIVRTLTVTKQVPVLPPEELLAFCEIPSAPKTEGRKVKNPELLNYAMTLIQALDDCNVSWQSLHDWRERKLNESQHTSN